MKKIQDKELESTMKSLDTAEFLDIYFYHPVGYRWAKLFERWNIHPNTVTIFSIIIGVAAGVLFFFPDLRLNVIGMMLLVWANIYDSADGQLARMTGKKTHWGRILDGFAGDAWFFFIYHAISFREYFQPMPFGDKDWGITFFLIAIICGYGFHSYQCQLSDYYRNIHLLFLKGKKGSEMDNSKQQRRMCNTLTWRHNLFFKFVVSCYLAYTESQEKMTPAFQQFYALIKDKYNGNIPQSLRDDFRKQSKPLMKYCNLITFNTRIIFLFFCLYIDQLWLYLAFEAFVMTAICAYLNIRHELMCMRLYKKVLANEY